jgi:hypothetical protein
MLWNTTLQSLPIACRQQQLGGGIAYGLLEHVGQVDFTSTYADSGDNARGRSVYTKCSFSSAHDPRLNELTPTLGTWHSNSALLLSRSWPRSQKAHASRKRKKQITRQQLALSHACRQRKLGRFSRQEGLILSAHMPGGIFRFLEPCSMDAST